jgi:hypothetical protein
MTLKFLCGSVTPDGCAGSLGLPGRIHQSTLALRNGDFQYSEGRSSEELVLTLPLKLL